jgi:hypothetical protein
MLLQHAPDAPFEIFTIDGLFTDGEVAEMEAYVEGADGASRFTTMADFKNGKVVDPRRSSLFYTRIQPFLPDAYVDRAGQRWAFVRSPSKIMYARVGAGQHFSLHTDTGCEYDDERREYSKFTVLTYLNDSFDGGGTKFYDHSFRERVTIEPRRNRTLVFDIDLYHSGERVARGVKCWMGTELVCRREAEAEESS